jgi:hypothetical protein
MKLKFDNLFEMYRDKIGVLHIYNNNSQIEENFHLQKI